MGSVCALKEESLGKQITTECANTVECVRLDLDGTGTTYIVVSLCVCARMCVSTAYCSYAHYEQNRRHSSKPKNNDAGKICSKQERFGAIAQLNSLL